VAVRAALTRHRTTALVLAAAVVCAVGAGVAVEFSQTSPVMSGPIGSFGRFASYGAYGPTTSVTADWRVPVFSPRSPAGHAATWIGLQGPKEFVQVGTFEARAQTSTGVYENTLFVFWSDSAVRYVDQSLGSVHQGDRVQASIDDSATGWRLRLIDQTRNKVFQRTLALSNVTFEESDWVQEDPLLPATQMPVPYPELTAVTFTHVLSNDRIPTLNLDDALWLSQAGRIYSVSPLRHDQFTVALTHLTRPQQQFLIGVAEEASATAKFTSSVKRGFPTSSAAKSALAKLQLADAELAGAMDGLNLSTTGGADVQAVVKLQRQRMERLEKEIDTGSSRATAAAQSQLRSTDLALDGHYVKIERALGLPSLASLAPAPATTPSKVVPSETSTAVARSAQASANRIAARAGCPSNPTSRVNSLHWSSPPRRTINPSDVYTASVVTTAGSFVIALDAKSAPATVNNFVFLADHEFFRCVTFDRVIPGFIDQTGDPTGTLSGGPGYQFSDENIPKAYVTGDVATANLGGRDSNGSQFFIVAAGGGPALTNDISKGFAYSLFGRVISGMTVVAAINQGGTTLHNGIPPSVVQRIISVTIHVRRPAGT
jgi:cyclophilin family peptidyl-prolyl cis-trans isomerase